MTDLEFDLFWSMRSPYCYLLLDRMLKLSADTSVGINLRIVLPVAIRNPEFFHKAPAHYRPYHMLDSEREAARLGLPYRRPVPDPVSQDMETNAIAAEQPYIRRLSYLAAAAIEQGEGLAFLDQVMRMLWDGSVDGWDQGTHLAGAITRAGLDAEALMKDVAVHPETFETIIETNQKAQGQAGHPGVPLMVFQGEPFFGQDRFDTLVWRLRQHGLGQRG